MRSRKLRYGLRSAAPGVWLHRATTLFALLEEFCHAGHDRRTRLQGVVGFLYASEATGGVAAMHFRHSRAVDAMNERRAAAWAGTPAWRIH